MESLPSQSHHPSVFPILRAPKGEERVLRALLQIGSHLLPILHANWGPIEGTYEPRNEQSNLPDSIGTPESCVWTFVYANDIELLWWPTTAAIILLDEAMGIETCPSPAKIRDLVAELRSLRDLIVSIYSSVASAVALPLRGVNPVEPPNNDVINKNYELEVSQEVAQELLERRSRNIAVCQLAEVTLSSTNLGSLLRQVAATCRSAISLSTADRELLTNITTNICSMIDDDVMSTSLAPLTNECHLVGELMSIGANLQTAYDVNRITKAKWERQAFGERDSMEEDMGGFRRVTIASGHLNIMPMVGKCDDTGQVTLLKPWSKHGTLATYLRDNPDVNRRRLLQDVASALAHLHEQHEVHGSVDLQHVFISRDGDAMLCPMMHSNTEVPNAAYVAPELHSGSTCSLASDTFAFGMLCLESYSGSNPTLWIQDVESTIREIVRGGRPSRCDVNRADFTEEMWQMVQRCWAADPDERPSMAAVRQMLYAMDTPEELEERESRGVKIRYRLFPDDHDNLAGRTRDQRLADSLQIAMILMESTGVKEFVAKVMGPRDCTPVTALLESARARRAHFVPPCRGRES